MKEKEIMMEQQQQQQKLTAVVVVVANEEKDFVSDSDHGIVTRTQLLNCCSIKKQIDDDDENNYEDKINIIQYTNNNNNINNNEQKHDNDVDTDDDDSMQRTNYKIQYGVVHRVPIISSYRTKDMWEQYANEYIQITPEILAMEGDQSYAFYRNILHDDTFPFHNLLFDEVPQILSNDEETTTTTEQIQQEEEERKPSFLGQMILNHFPNIINLQTDIRLDDAFCIHYNMNQLNTLGSLHMDPSDITINICIEKSNDCIGSHVLFHGKQTLCNENIIVLSNDKKNMNTTTTPLGIGSGEEEEKDTSFTFPIVQEAMYASIHYGHHPHETTKLEKGTRTNLIFTYCYTNPPKNGYDVSTRTCYL